MNGRRAINNRPTCRQSWCPMRQTKSAPEDVAEWILRHVSRDSARKLPPADRRIATGPYCKECIVNIIIGKGFFHTEAEWNRLDEAGRWHDRRERRTRAGDARRLCLTYARGTIAPVTSRAQPGQAHGRICRKL